MPDAVAHSKERFLCDLQEATTLPSPDWVKQLRSAAVERVRALDFPTRHQEDWRFTNIMPVMKEAFRTPAQAPVGKVSTESMKPVLWGTGCAELVFLNGFFTEALSRMPRCHNEALAVSLAAAFREDRPVIQQHLSRVLRGNGSIFPAVNTAFLLDGACVHVPKGHVAAEPIHLVFVATTGDEALAAHPRNLIVLEPGAEATIVESYIRLDGESPHLTNVVTEIRLAEGARLRGGKLIAEETGYHFAAVHVLQDRDSSLEFTTICAGSRIARNELCVMLDGEGASCSLNGLYMTEGEQVADNAIAVRHAQPRCSSWINYKGVLRDRSHGVFCGKIRVDRHAQKTDSKQVNRNLLLSDQATVNTRPVLEIFADDVKCTHGATVGQPPADLIYYFRTRGMSAETARAMLTYGFAQETVQTIEAAPLRERIDGLVFRRYHPNKTRKGMAK